MQAVALRGGYQASDPRLDRLPEFDERSRNFRAVEQLGAEEQRKGPRSYTWRCQTRLDQGREGACVGFGLTHELVARPAEALQFSDPHTGAQFARQEVYWQAQRRDPWEGGAYPNASPRYEGTSVLAGVQVIHELGYIGSYHWAFGEEELALTVGYLGPVVIGINWYEGMFNPNSKGFIEPTGRVAGGHAILVNSLRVRTRTRTSEWYELVNSWGDSWGIRGPDGRGGACRISREHMDRLLRERGEAVIFKARVREPQAA